MSPLEQGTPDFSRSYQNFDSNSFNNHEAQAHYAMLKRQMADSSALFNQNQAQNIQYLTGGSSLRGMRDSSIFGTPSFNDSYSFAHQQSLYGTDLTNRGIEAVGGMYSNLISPVANIAAMFKIDEMLDPFFSSYGASAKMRAPVIGMVHGPGGWSNMNRIKNLAHMNWKNIPKNLGIRASGFGGSMVAGTAIANAGMFALEGGARFMGVDDAFTQFENIDNIRVASESWTAGTSGNAFTGGMSRSSSKEIYDFIQEEAVLGKSRKGGKSFKELIEDVGTFNDLNLMQGVRSADEFKRKFSALTNAVQKITETLGKSFEEGAELLSQYQSVGIRPEVAMGTIQSIRGIAQNSGISFDRANASGMQMGMAMQGTGFSAGAALSLGARTEGLSQQISDQVMGGQAGALDARQFYNAGGQQGVQQSLANTTIATLQNPIASSYFMGAWDPSTKSFNTNTLLQLAGSGDLKTSMQRITQVFNGPNSAQNMLEYRGALGAYQSEMMEANPDLILGMTIETVYAGLRAAGMNPDDMSENAIAQMAPQVTQGQVSPNDYMNAAAALRSSRDGEGRAAIEQYMTGEGIARDRFQGGIKPFLRKAFSNLTPVSAEAHTQTAGAMYEASRGIGRYIDRQRGVYTFNIDSGMQEAYKRMGIEKDIEDEGQFFREAGVKFFGNDEADITHRVLEQDSFKDLRRVRIKSNAIRNGKILLDYNDPVRRRGSYYDQLSQMGLTDDMITFDRSGARFTTIDQLRSNFSGFDDYNVLGGKDLELYDTGEYNQLSEGMGRDAETIAGALKKYSGHIPLEKEYDQFRKMKYELFSSLGGTAGMQKLFSDDAKRGDTLRNEMFSQIRMAGIDPTSARGGEAIGYLAHSIEGVGGEYGGKAVREMMDTTNLKSFSDADTARERIEEMVRGVTSQYSGSLTSKSGGGVTVWDRVKSKFFGIDDLSVANSGGLTLDEKGQRDFANAYSLYQEKGEQDPYYRELAEGFAFDITKVFEEEFKRDPKEARKKRQSMRENMARADITDDVEGGSGDQEVSGTGGGSVATVDAMNSIKEDLKAFMGPILRRLDEQSARDQQTANTLAGLERRLAK